jgi:hypothetical protein
LGSRVHGSMKEVSHHSVPVACLCTEGVFIMLIYESSLCSCLGNPICWGYLGLFGLYAILLRSDRPHFCSVQPPATKRGALSSQSAHCVILMNICRQDLWMDHRDGRAELPPVSDTCSTVRVSRTLSSLFQTSSLCLPSYSGASTSLASP